MSVRFANYLPGNNGFNALSLHEALRAAVAEYRVDPRQCLPALPSFAATARPTIVLLGATPFSQLFIMESAARVHIIGVVDDFQASKGALFHGVPILSSSEFLDVAAKETVVAVNGCRYDHARRYFKNLTLRHDVPMLNFEQAIRWLGVTCTDHRIQDWGGYIVEHAESLGKLAQRFDDDYSRITLFCVLLSHLTCDPEWLLNCAKPYLTLYFRSGLWTMDYGRWEPMSDSSTVALRLRNRPRRCSM